jgi:hypothetical protein
MGTGGSPPEVKRLERESAKAKNEWSRTTTPLYVFMMQCFIKHMHIFLTFTERLFLIY